MDSITMRLSNVTVINHDLEANREGKGIEPTYSFYPQYSMPKRSPPSPSSMQNVRSSPPNRELSTRTSDRYVETMEQYQHTQQGRCQGKGGCKFKRFR